MKTIHICTVCGSPRVWRDADKAINSDEIRTFDAVCCDDCEDRDASVREVQVTDEFDIDTMFYSEAG